MSDTDFPINCTGDVVAGDTIRFTEAVFGGSHRRPVKVGERVIVARVLRDSYGADKQQHTFTLKVIASEGYQPLQAGTQTTRKGRNIYRNGTQRAAWDDEGARATAADEKHTRGAAARAERAIRREIEGYR